MDVMKKRMILTPLAFVLAVSTALADARAEDQISAQKWAQDLTAAVKAKDSKKVQQLTDLEALSKKMSACDDCDTKETLARARQLYAQGKYEDARELYGHIPKSNPSWLQAVEEKGWAYFRQDQLEESLAQAKTLLSPQFSGYVGSEAYFLQSLAQLKSCNYKGVFETTRLFKEKQKPRLVEIQNLMSTGTNEALKNVLETADRFPMSFAEVGTNANHLPQLFYKDIGFQSQVLKHRLATEALRTLPTEGSYASLRASLEKTRNASLAKLQDRMRELARRETEDNSKIVQKLNLVEVEAIQRLHNDVDLDNKLFKKGNFKETNSDQLVFVDDGRPWIDELDKYEVRVKSCPQNLRRKM